MALRPELVVSCVSIFIPAEVQIMVRICAIAFQSIPNYFNKSSPNFSIPTSFGKESVWNVDGEILQGHQISAQVNRGLGSLFATGPEV